MLILTVHHSLIIQESDLEVGLISIDWSILAADRASSCTARERRRKKIWHMLTDSANLGISVERRRSSLTFPSLPDHVEFRMGLKEQPTGGRRWKSPGSGVVYLHSVCIIEKERWQTAEEENRTWRRRTLKKQEWRAILIMERFSKNKVCMVRYSDTLGFVPMASPTMVERPMGIPYSVWVRCKWTKL